MIWANSISSILDYGKRGRGMLNIPPPFDKMLLSPLTANDGWSFWDEFFWTWWLSMPYCQQGMEQSRQQWTFFINWTWAGTANWCAAAPVFLGPLNFNIPMLLWQMWILFPFLLIWANIHREKVACSHRCPSVLHVLQSLDFISLRNPLTKSEDIE